MNQSDYTEVTFIADFPGMYLENFLNTDLGNTTVEVLDGDIEVELVDQEGGKHKLGVGERMKLQWVWIFSKKLQFQEQRFFGSNLFAFPPLS